MSDQLRDKLGNYEAAPPANSWEVISEALEDQGSPLAGRLYHFEQAPDGRTWEQITKELDAATAEDRPAIPFYKRYRLPLRYSGVAAALIIAAAVTFFLVNRNEGRRELAREGSGHTSAAPGASSRIKPGSGVPDAGSDKAIPGNDPDIPNSNDRISPDLPFANPPLAGSPATRTNANRYLTVASEEGKPVRLSKKVYPVFDCAEHSTAVKRYRCKENIEALQQKVASSLASPSGDFASLMDMIRTLEENP